MRQLSLLDDATRLAGVMASVRAAMRAAAGAPESEGRKALPDKLNALARHAGVKLTQGNQSSISKDTLDKWLSPSDTSHTPSLLAVLVFCRATGSVEPLRMAAQALGLDLMTEEERKLCEYGRSIHEEREARKRRRKLENDL